jgi:uncharacterized protein involved in type VI secretion and phage assembly
VSTRFSGVVVGVVTNRTDPEGRGRIQVRFPWLGSEENSAWASIAAPMAGGGRGAFFMPEEQDEVLLAFEHGDFANPYVIGFMWNGVHEPPSTDPRERMIRSRNGHTIRFLDSTPTGGDNGALVIEDANGNVITLSNGKITIAATATLELNAPSIILRGPGYVRTVLPVPRPI